MKSLTLLGFSFLVYSSLSWGNPLLGQADSVFILGKELITDYSGIRPVVGWEQFKRNIHYPEDMRKREEGCSFHISASIDSSGVIDKIDFSDTTSSSSFFRSIATAIKSTTWLRTQTDEMSITFDVLFVPRVGDQPHAIVIESKGSYMEVESQRDANGNYRNVMKSFEAPDLKYLVQRSRNSLTAEDLNIPQPIIGWDSLAHRFYFPETAKRIGFDGTFLAIINFNAIGAIKNFTLKPDYEMYTELVGNILKSTSWTTATKNGKPADGKITIPIIFCLKSFPQHVIIIESR